MKQEEEEAIKKQEEKMNDLQVFISTYSMMQQACYMNLTYYLPGLWIMDTGKQKHVN